jgi:hypothetical protein
MVSRFTERDNVRDRARGQSASYAPTTRNQRREPNRFVQGVKNFGNDARQMGSDFSGALQNNPVTNTIQKGVDYGRDNIMEKFPSLMGAAMTGVKSVARTAGMFGQNRKYFDGNWLDDKIPDNVIDSMMTQKDKDFYDKYMMLAEREQDRTRKDEYLATAKTAKRNAQNTGRLNYALSQIDPDNEYINSAGLPSYSQDLFGEGYGRLNMDAFREAMGMGEGILGGLSEEDRNGEVLENYAQQTFRPNMADVAGPAQEKMPMPNISTEFDGDISDGDISREDRLQALVEEEQRRIDNFETNAYSDILDDAIENQWPTVQGQMDDPFADISAGAAGLYGGSMTEEEKYLQERKRMDEYKKFYMNQGEMDNPFYGTAPEPYPMPFDDSNREQGIMDQQYQSPIGPRDDPSRRPNMMNVSGRGINRGLFPYPGYNDPVNIEQFGRGEIPYGFDYDQSNKDRQDSYKLDQILGRIIPEEEEMEEEFQMFGPRGR